MSTRVRPGANPDVMGLPLCPVFVIRGYGSSPLFFLIVVYSFNNIQSVVSGSRFIVWISERVFRRSLRIVCMVESGSLGVSS